MIRRAMSLVIAVGTMSSSTYAADSDAQVVADTLFTEAKKLLAAGDIDSACPKFAESVRLDPGIGAILHLADCHERQGKLASAFTEFRTAADLARKSADKRLSIAEDRALKLEPRLTRVTIVVPSNVDVSGLVVKRNGVAVGKEAWNLPIPVDPGTVTVSAEAPGYESWTQRVDIERGRETVTLHLGPPVASTAAVAAPLSEPPQASATNRDDRAWQTPVGFGALGVGVVGLGIGTFFGVSALGKAADSEEHCPRSPACDATGVTLRDDAKSLGTVSTVSLVAGTVFVAAGAYLVLSAPKARATTAWSPRGVTFTF